MNPQAFWTFFKQEIGMIFKEGVASIDFVFYI